MSAYVITVPARLDLEEIDSFISSDSPTAANRLLASLYTTFEMLAALPEAGRRRDEFAPGLRSFPTGSYIVFYRQVGDTVEILRVLHGRRDAERVFDV